MLKSLGDTWLPNVRGDVLASLVVAIAFSIGSPPPPMPWPC
ncbi:hypothetical protein [Azotobacter chroococcum]|nr:hypothetical protein [Azotobacter chroococcum]